jgi:hypothetical protein
VTDSSKYTELAATILRIGVAIGLLLFALQLLYGATIETAVMRSFLLSSAVSVVIVVVRVVFIHAQAAALKATPKTTSSKAAAQTSDAEPDSVGADARTTSGQSTGPNKTRLAA